MHAVFITVIIVVFSISYLHSIGQFDDSITQMKSWIPSFNVDPVTKSTSIIQGNENNPRPEQIVTAASKISELEKSSATLKEKSFLRDLSIANPSQDSAQLSKSHSTAIAASHSLAIPPTSAAIPRAPSDTASKTPVPATLAAVPKSKFAYTTLVHGIDETLRYRGYLISCVVIKQALLKLGSTADFVAMLGFTSSKAQDLLTSPTELPADSPPSYVSAIQVFRSDMALLKRMGIIVHILPRLLKHTQKIRFAEMALLKMTPWTFTQYDRVQFLDGDILPTKNLDCFFKLNSNTFNTGSASPVNSGWFVALPNVGAFESMKTLALHRLNTPWNETTGWGTAVPSTLYYRGWTRKVKAWDFNGASLDQGLITHYYVLNNGGVTLLDERSAMYFAPQHVSQLENLRSVLACCSGVTPMQSYAHFTGSKKPWLSPDLGQPTASKQLKLWGSILDSLHLDLNSSNIAVETLKPPLGYWHPNKK